MVNIILKVTHNWFATESLQSGINENIRLAFVAY